MMKKCLYNIIRCILPTALLVLVVVSCSVKDEEEPSAAHEVTVRLGISITSARSEEGADDGNPKDLKVWIFGKSSDDGPYKAIQCHTLRGDLQPSATDLQGNPVVEIDSWTIDIADYTCLAFVVLVNTYHLNTNNLTEEEFDEKYDAMSYKDIKALSFESMNAATDNEVLMFGETEVELSSKKDYYITVPAKRVVGKLELFFTKAVESSTLTITKVELSNIPEKGYVDKKNVTEGITTSVEDVFNGREEVKTVLDPTTDVDYVIGNFSKHEEYFTKLFSEFLLENPNGFNWLVYNGGDYIYPEENEGVPLNAYKLTVSYELDNEENSKSFYLPKVERNKLYKIYVRVLKAQDIKLYYSLANWENKEIDVPFN